MKSLLETLEGRDHDVTFELASEDGKCGPEEHPQNNLALETALKLEWDWGMGKEIQP